MTSKTKEFFLKYIVDPNSLDKECTEEFLDNLREMVVFDLPTEFPLIKNITDKDIGHTRDPKQKPYYTYHVNFSENFISQIKKFYPEFLI